MLEPLLILLIVIEGARLVVEVIMARQHFMELRGLADQGRIMERVADQQNAAFEMQQSALAEAEKVRSGKTVYRQTEEGTEAVYVPPTSQ